MCQVQRLGEVISRRRNSHEIQQLKRVEEIVRHSSESWRARDKELLHNEKKWTIAEGAIYADFDKDKHIVKQAPDNIVHYYAGVDWGYDHYGSIVILGETADGTTYIVDGVAKQYEEIDYWVEQAHIFKVKYGDIDFYADSARPEHVVRFAREGFKVHNARKEVIAGIEEVAKLWKNDRLFYVQGSIPRFEDEIYQYKWKPNSQKDEPLKEYDDVLDALRYAIYTERNAKIKVSLLKGGF